MQKKGGGVHFVYTISQTVIALIHRNFLYQLYELFSVFKLCIYKNLLSWVSFRPRINAFFAWNFKFVV